MQGPENYLHYDGSLPTRRTHDRKKTRKKERTSPEAASNSARGSAAAATTGASADLFNASFTALTVNCDTNTRGETKSGMIIVKTAKEMLKSSSPAFLGCACVQHTRYFQHTTGTQRAQGHKQPICFYHGYVLFIIGGQRHRPTSSLHSLA